MKAVINKILIWIDNLFAAKCPDCKGKLHTTYFDIELDKMVYECDNYNKEWI